ncbi:MAG: DUF1015 family protein [Actinomycetota bacterium]|nr:DUF1015 family protein [Actinomycetota bacterium]
MLERAVADGLIVPSAGRRLFRYQIRRRAHDTVVGLVGVARATDLIPHEDTIEESPGHSAPRVEIRPILAIVEAPLPELSPLGRPVIAIEDDGTEHELVAVDAGAPLLFANAVIADGHHRRRAAMATNGADATVLTMVVGDRGAGLEAGAFHRVFGRATPLPSAAGQTFEVEPLPSPTVVEDALVWVEGASGRAFSLRPLPAAAATVHASVRRSPAALAHALLYPLLGVAEREASHTGNWEVAIQDIPRSGGALLLPDVEVDAVIVAARAGRLLPPKASRFRPKPLRGMVLRLSSHQPSASSHQQDEH